MKNKIVFLALLLITQLAVAGDKTLNGGDAVVCRGVGGSESVELLDLYEAKYRHGYRLETFAEQEPELILRQVFYKPNPMLSPETFRSSVEISMLIQEDSIPEVGDEGRVEIPSHCSLRQLAVWDDNDNRIYVHRELWARLDSMNKAALLLHEMIWKGERTFGSSKTSEQIRKRVAKRFAVGQLRAKPKANGSTVRCRIHSPSDFNLLSEIEFIPEEGGLNLQFNLLRNRIVLDDTGVRIPVRLGKDEYRLLANEIGGEMKSKLVSNPRLRFDLAKKLEFGEWEGTDLRVVLKKGSSFRIYIDGERQRIEGCAFVAPFLKQNE